MTDRRFILILGLTGFLVLLAIGTTNYHVDPFGIFERDLVTGFNDRKYHHGLERFFVPYVVAKQSGKTLVLGSSRSRAVNTAAADYFDPQGIRHAALSAITAREAVEALTFLGVDQNASTIIYVPDFFSFNAKIRYDPGFIPGIVASGDMWRFEVIALFSYTALDASYRTVLNSRTPPSTNTASQSASPTTVQSLEHEFSVQLNHYKHQSRYYRDFVLDEQVFGILADTLRSAKQRGTEIVLFLGPSHAWQWEAIHESGLWPQFERWKRQLAAIGAEVGVEVWDFASYSRISTPAIPDAITHYKDSSHYTLTTARIAFECMYHNRGCESLHAAQITLEQHRPSA